ncbi:MAG: UDP-glucose 4-epimerase GalE [Actinomycetales bacterium mxb001]|nr:MAG: UDP-glucose 4-epimerase GalE [Actinomycetales bacterium mxb001]
MTTWLLTGGAGYIGAHVARDLLASGRQVVVLDDLSAGHRDRVPADAAFVEASVLDTDAVRAALTSYDVTGVIHLAAKKAVGESVEKPLLYFRENVGGMTSLLQAMADAGTRCLVYSSSAAVYGEPPWSPISEDTPCAPLSPYGQTKLIGEWMVRDEAAARPLSWVALRYFNVAGAGSPELGDTSANNLIPMVFDALDRGEAPQVFGSDYPTADGSCVRDYIHVSDLSEAHVAAAALAESGDVAAIFNVGTGTGASVWEVMASVSDVVGRDIGAVAVERRAGDPPELVASVDRISGELGWAASRDLRDMVASAWAARG